VKGLGGRVQVLERRQPVGCAVCQWWHGTIVVSLDEEGDETGRSRPGRCPGCGREVAGEHVVQIIGVPWDVV
jgi:hypothetical protein